MKKITQYLALGELAWCMVFLIIRTAFVMREVRRAGFSFWSMIKVLYRNEYFDYMYKRDFVACLVHVQDVLHLWILLAIATSIILLAMIALKKRANSTN